MILQNSENFPEEELELIEESDGYLVLIQMARKDKYLLVEYYPD